LQTLKDEIGAVSGQSQKEIQDTATAVGQLIDDLKKNVDALAPLT